MTGKEKEGLGKKGKRRAGKDCEDWLQKDIETALSLEN